MSAATFLGWYGWIEGRLEKRRLQADAIFDRYTAKEINAWRFRFLSEALVANLWLDWNAFVKELILLSCNGGTTRTGVVVAPRPAANNSEARITYEFRQHATGKPVNPAAVHTSVVEPTWAHPGTIITSITGLGVGNVGTLQSAFGAAGLTGQRRLHLVRNATAHKTRHMRNEVKNLRSVYSTDHFVEPIDIIWGTVPGTTEIAIYEWIDDLLTIADLATS
jgi:hypothetical protein